ncbi:MAG: hypothetical protein KJ977_04890 [Candidatus Omnitrophica bacterium]|nr:hypothetical protein [Candidatus Omnitrophota bacterium]MBU2251226.1 hypothetical protein [Candidatus Omnitrophota bacterium]MBU2266358.1 hypothetical protein [Candidatus Omnitrophota bacterium]
MNKSYIEYQEALLGQEKKWEGLCRRCGGCCGAYDDPCQHLKGDAKSGFYCTIYPQRFGLKKTVNGEEFDCVLVKEILHTYWKNDHICAYKQYLKMPWKI